MINKFIKPVYAHCDLMCGVYDPAQARIEAESVRKSIQKYHESDDEIFKARAIAIKEERAQLVKEHLWVLWTDYFKAEHLEAHPTLHTIVWEATKAASSIKKSVSLSEADDFIAAVDKVGEIFAKTKDGYSYEAVLKNLS